jgi:hypothetical protein
MMTKAIVVEGVVARLGDKYWGCQYEDGHSTEYGFGPVENAKVSSPKYCQAPEDMTYREDYQRAELAKAVLVPIRITRIYDVGE